MYSVFTSAYCKYSLLALTGAALFLTSNMATAAKTQYPLTIKNCGRDITFNKAPQRVTTVGQKPALKSSILWVWPIAL